MNNSPSISNSIRQPAPSVSDAKKSNEDVIDRKYNAPNVGVVTLPQISKTPLADTITIKKQENPQSKYKFSLKTIKGFKIQNFCSIAIMGCSIGALLQLLRK